MELKRKKFQGVLNILSFNRHFYVLGLGTLAVMIVWHLLTPWPTTLFYLVSAAFIYGLMMPLFVSAYVYDYSGYYELQWLNDVIRANPKAKLMLNINAGFDETSFLLKDKFPNADLKVFDFYEAKRHTEPAIIRARKVSLNYPNTTHIESSKIPLEDQSADVIFLLSAAHEIRQHAEKVDFLKECRRVCKPGGQIIMVEHLRDLPNFVAFSVGFTHFFSRATWSDAFYKAGFDSFTERKFTPFMSVFFAPVKN